MKTTLTILIVLCSLFGCNDKPEPKPGPAKIERDYLSEIFHEQTYKAIYHSKMQIKYIDSNYPLSKKHLDSLLMAVYASQVVYNKMYPKK